MKEILKTKNKNEEQKQELRFKNRIIFVLLLIVAFSMYKFATYPSQITIHTAPDISRSFVQKVGDVPKTTIYGFARTLWETLNFCETDCTVDFPKKIETYKEFLTKACYKELKNHFDFNKRLYSGRTRRLLPTDNSIFDLSRVEQISSATWVVNLEYMLDDDINGITTRKQIMNYSLEVSSSQVPTQFNPWGLAINCHSEEPKVVEYLKLEEIK